MLNYRCGSYFWLTPYFYCLTLYLKLRNTEIKGPVKSCRSIMMPSPSGLRPLSSLSTLILGDLILSNDLSAIYVLMTPNFFISSRDLTLELIYLPAYSVFPLDV